MLGGEEKKDACSPPLQSSTGVANPLAASGAVPPASSVTMPMKIEFPSAPDPRKPLGPSPSAGAAAVARTAAAAAPGTTPAGVPNPIMASSGVPFQTPVPAPQFADDPTTPAPLSTPSIDVLSPLASPILTTDPPSRPASALTVGSHGTSTSTMNAMEKAMMDEPAEEQSYEPPNRRRRSNTIHWAGTATSVASSHPSNPSLKDNESLQPVNFGDGGQPSTAGLSPGPARKMSNASSSSSMGIRSTSSNSLYSEYSETSASIPSGGGSPRQALTSAAVPGAAGMKPAAVPRPTHMIGPNPTTAPLAPIDKRQKRLERNRESARASRRRRKHYLEELELKVTRLSEEIDRGRLNHACMAVRTVRGMRVGKLREAERMLSLKDGAGVTGAAVGGAGIAGMRPPGVKSGIAHNVTSVPRPLPPPNSQSLDRAVAPLTGNLSRTSDELQIVQTFMRQHLLSLVQPTSTKFMLWLSLQKDGFYRGGRSASERLSAARIGERLLHSGTERAPPNNGMWPLTCHEIGLSYDQEDRIRQIQRTVLANSNSWVNRHTALATKNAIENVHDSINVTQQAAKKREQSLMSILTPEQRVKFMAWAEKRKDVIRRLAEAKIRGAASSASAGAADVGDGEYKTSRDRHVAANLYIVSHLLSKVKQRAASTSQPQTAGPSSFIPPNKLKKLSRRPQFESLSGQQGEDGGSGGKLSRETSFPSTGSLKRNLDGMSISDSNPHDPMSMNSQQNSGVTPESAQAAAQPAVMAVLKDVMPIVPKSAWYSYPPSTATAMTVGTAPHRPVAAVSQHQAFQPPRQKPRAQPRRATMPTPIAVPPQPMAAVARTGIVGQPPPPGDDLAGVDDIPMPTPVSVLLQTSDDFISAPVYEQQQQEPLEAMSSSITPIAGADFPIPEQVSSFLPQASAPAGLLRSRHQSAPDFTSYRSLVPAPMAIIPESSNLIVSNPTVMGTDAPNDIVGDFGLEDLPLGADDWAIGEGFDMEVDRGTS